MMVVSGLSLSGSEPGCPCWTFSPSTTYCEGLLYDWWVVSTPLTKTSLRVIFAPKFSRKRLRIWKCTFPWECYKCPASISLKQSEYWLILDLNGKIKLITDHKKVHKKQTPQLLSGNVLLKQWTENILLPQITFKCHLQNSYASKDGAVSCPEIKNDMTLSSDKASKWFWFYHVMVKDKNAVYSWHL